MIAPQELIFFLVTTKRCVKDSFFKWLELHSKNKSLKYEKSEKQTFEISIWVKKRQNYFVQKLRACARGGKLFF